MKKNWSKLLLLLASVMIALCLIAGCGNSSVSGGSKDTLKVAFLFSGENADPADGYNGWFLMEQGVGQALTKFDEKMNLQPWLATKWSVAADNKTWTFVINEKAKFSNGNPVTAEAVKASIERTFEKNKRAASFFKFKEMKAEGNTLTIVTEKTNPNIAEYLADPMFTIVDVAAEKAGRDFKAAGPIATGPYEVKSFAKDKTVVVANKNYWNGKVPFKEIEFPLISDANTRALALKSGNVDAVINVAPEQMGQFKDNKDFKISEVTSIRSEFGLLNEHGILGDPVVREALILATNKKAYVGNLLHGAYEVSNAPIPPTLGFGYDKLTAPNSYNVEKAEKLLADNGWKKNAEGILEKNGKTLTLTLVGYKARASLPVIAEAMQADLKKIGIAIKLEIVDTKASVKMLEEGKYDIFLYSINAASSGDPVPFLTWYWKTNVNGDNPQNTTGYSNAAVDTKLTELESEMDKTKRALLVQEVQQLILNDRATLFLCYPKVNIVMSKDVKNLQVSPLDIYVINEKVEK